MLMQSDVSRSAAAPVQEERAELTTPTAVYTTPTQAAQQSYH